MCLWLTVGSLEGCEVEVVVIACRLLGLDTRVDVAVHLLPFTVIVRCLHRLLFLLFFPLYSLLVLSLLFSFARLVPVLGLLALSWLLRHVLLPLLCAVPFRCPLLVSPLFLSLFLLCLQRGFVVLFVLRRLVLLLVLLLLELLSFTHH